MIFIFSNKSPTADIRIHIRGGIIQVPDGNAGISAITPVTTNMGEHAPYNPVFIFINTKHFLGDKSP